jgi:ankyrin repeat protein
MDIRHAAALGELDLVQRLFNDETKLLIEQAFIYACQYGHNNICAFLLDQGVDATSQAGIGQTGFHYAAHYGQLETVKMLISRNAPLEVKNMYGGTVLGQALWSAYNEPHKDHIQIVEALIAAGAVIAPDWNKWIDELRRREGKRI